MKRIDPKALELFDILQDAADEEDSVYPTPRAVLALGLELDQLPALRARLAELERERDEAQVRAERAETVAEKFMLIFDVPHWTSAELITSYANAMDIKVAVKLAGAIEAGRRVFNQDSNAAAALRGGGEDERDACQYNGEFARTEDAGNGLTRCEWCKTMTGEHARGCPSSITSEPMDVIRFLVKWAQKNSTLLRWTKESRDECRVALKEAQDGVDKANADLADLRERLSGGS